MSFTDFIIDNYIMLYELVGLAVLLMISAHFTEQAKKQTRLVVVLLLAESVAFAVERRTHDFAQLSVLRPILTAFVYSIYPVILVALMQIAVTTKISRRRRLLLMIPWIVAVPLYFTTQWTRLVCWFTPDNMWKPGPLRFLPYYIFAFYSLLFLIRNFLFFRNYARMNRFTAGYIVIGSLLGAVLIMLFREDQDYSAIFTSAALLYYSFFYTHMAKIDPLTALMNRQSYYQDMQTDEQKISAAVSADMNELKYYNDNFGHEAGDRALAVIAEILRKNCARGARVYRVGGDEFMFLCRGMDEAAVAAMIRRMREDLAQTPYTVAFGFAVRKAGEALESAIVAADARMYEDKAAIKRGILEQGGTLHSRD